VNASMVWTIVLQRWVKEGLKRGNLGQPKFRIDNHVLRVFLVCQSFFVHFFVQPQEVKVLARCILHDLDLCMLFRTLPSPSICKESKALFLQNSTSCQVT
jgi:hypothetical protein